MRVVPGASNVERAWPLRVFTAADRSGPEARLSF
jgi:hypothetical protein